MNNENFEKPIGEEVTTPAEAQETATAQTPAEPIAPQEPVEAAAPEAADESTDEPKKKKEKKAGSTKKAARSLVAIALVAVFVVGAILLLPLLKEDAEKPVFPFTVASIQAETRDVQTYLTESVMVYVETANCTESSLKIVNGDKKKLGVVKDNGEDGDALAGDGIYTGNIEFYSEVAEPTQIFVAYKDLVSESFETIYFYPEYQEEYFQSYKDIESAIQTISYQHSDPEQANAAILQMLAEKKNAEEIKDYTSENDSISITLPCGLVYVHSYNADDMFLSVGTAEDVPVQQGLYSVTPKVNKVLTVQPYYGYFDNWNCDTAGNIVAESEFNYIFNANVDNAAANVEAMKTLDQYNVIIWEGHGGYTAKNHSFLVTGQKTSTEDNKTYWPDLFYSRLIIRDQRYCITSSFIDHYYSAEDFGDAIVYLGACRGAADSVLAETFLSKGVDAVLAYDKSVTKMYHSMMVQTLFEELASNFAEPVTVKTALESAQATHGVNDVINEDVEKRATLCLFGDESATLKVESSTLLGKVADANTGAALYNATVSATLMNGGETVTRRTDREGNFSIPLTAGMYRIEVSVPNYMSCAIDNIGIESNSNTYLQNTVLLERQEGNATVWIEGIITNAVTGEPIHDAVIKFRKNYNNLNGSYVTTEDGSVLEIRSDSNGFYSTDLLEYGYYTAEISKDEFTTQYVNVVASSDALSYQNQDILLVPLAHGTSFRITLEWEENPRDEDSHIVGNTPDTNFHVFYMNKTAYSPNGDLIANLDHDDTQGNGFETVTLDVDPEGTYRYYVHHYAGSGSLSTSNAIVKVYQGGVMIKQYNVPVDQGTGIYWNVFNIVNGQVVSVNRISNNPS